MHLTILYRGSLISCNYGCEYCPFAKKQQTAAELATERQELERFINWISQHPQHQFSILFTPWGEALIHTWYQQGLIRLTQMPQVFRLTKTGIERSDVIGAWLFSDRVQQLMQIYELK